MDIWVFIGFVVVGAVVVIAIRAAMRAYLSLRVNRALRPESHGRAHLEPERQFVVRVADSDVVCERPDGTQERVTWNDLRRVEIVSTSEGPMMPDTFWLLVGETGGCAIPWGATGEAQLLERLQALPGFDNAALIGAASDSADSRRLCWRRTS